ncbi:trigger factor [Stratiformator vulcanicus]|uniref:Trigger factor n=1 Tax=Stratiformator vulcanicus TaxID=2527980 RepID=A0A517QZC2_9PLAN|nr:trigger factor [Stratiformator vulcanicus]QDT36995.1 Trigger factor [Stratiformator vulcanicus]
MSTDVAAPEAEEKRLNLNVDVKDSGPCLKHVRVTVAREDIDGCYDEMTDEFSESAQVPGFRPGKAPKELVMKRFKDDLDVRVKQKILFESLEQLAEEQNLEPINEPDLDIETLDIPDEGDFEYEFDVEVRPDFDMPDYTGLEIEQYDADVSDEQVQAAMNRYLAQYGQLVPEEGNAEMGDHLTLAAKFTHGNDVIHEIEEFTAELKPVLYLRDAEIDNFGELLEGAEIDAKITTEISVSPEAEKVELRGEKVTAEFELLDLKRLELPEMNASLLDRVGVESEEELRDNIRNSLERQGKHQQRQHARNQVLTKITASADWELPEKLVRRQTDNALRREILEMQQAGYTSAEIRARENQIRQNAISETREALKQHFVLDKIAEQENIEVTSQDIEMEITMMAMQAGESPRRVAARLRKSGMIENLQAQLRERKAIDFVLDKSEMKTVPAPGRDSDRIEAVDESVCGFVDHQQHDHDHDGDHDHDHDHDGE